MAKNNDLAAMLAAFNARGGKVQKIETGVRTMSEREIYLAQRDHTVTVTPIESAEGDYFREMGFQAEAKRRVRG